MCGQYFASYVVHRVELWLPMTIVHRYFLSSRFLFGGYIYDLHKSHESETLIIYQMLNMRQMHVYL